jgi:hypothetical protein
VAAAQCGCAVGSHTLGARRRRPKYKSAALRYVYDADVNAAEFIAGQYKCNLSLHTPPR